MKRTLPADTLWGKKERKFLSFRGGSPLDFTPSAPRETHAPTEKGVRHGWLVVLQL
jgi:hypothetical protein